MSIKQLVIVTLLGMSSVAVADGTSNATQDNQRMWTLQAAEKHAEHAQAKKTVIDPGVLVTSQRDPHDMK